MQKIYFFIVSVLISLTCSAIEAIDSTFVIQGAKGRLVTHLQLPAKSLQDSRGDCMSWPYR